MFVEILVDFLIKLRELVADAGIIPKGDKTNFIIITIYSIASFFHSQPLSYGLQRQSHLQGTLDTLARYDISNQ